MRRPSPATAIAVLALFLAAGGPGAVADAAKKLTGKDLADRSVTARDIARSTLTGTQVKDGALGERDLAAAVRAKLGAPGPAGAQGPAGPQGPQGPAGPNVVPDDGVTTDKVKDGLLRGADVGRFVTQVDLTFGVMNIGQCKSVTTTSLTPASLGTEDINDDVIVVTPPASWPEGFTLLARPAGANTVALSSCNLSGINQTLGERRFDVLTVDVNGQ